MGNALALGDQHLPVPMVDQDHLDLAAIAGVDHPGGIDDTHPVFRRQSASRSDEPDEAFGDGDGDSRRDNCTGAGRQRRTNPRLQIDTCVAWMGGHGYVNIRIEPAEGYLHGDNCRPARKRQQTSMTDPSPGKPSPRLPGNDGTWFLEAVGIATPPKTSEPADVTAEEILVDWESKSADALTGWAPEELSTSIDDGRRFRWLWAVATVAGLLALVAGFLWLQTSSSRRADARANAYIESLTLIRLDLPDSQQALAVLTEPEADTSQFAELIPTVTDLKVHAQDALALAGEALPNPWPLAPSAPIDELAPHRESVSREATSAEAIARRLANVLDYRTVVVGFLDVGELPATADDLSEVDAQLSIVAADSAALLGELPEDAALFDHRTAAQVALERFLDWRVEYADALRTGSADQVAVLLEEHATAQANLDRIQLEALALIRSETDAAIIELAAEIDLTIADLNTLG